MPLDQTAATATDFPTPGVPGRAVIPYTVADPPTVIPGQETVSHDPATRKPSPLADLSRGIDVRSISPREMSEFSLDLYAAGLLSYEEYTALSLHPELHPDFNRTIGALTGEVAAPDRRRDFVKWWEAKLEFRRRRLADDHPIVGTTERIVHLLRRLGRRIRLL